MYAYAYLRLEPSRRGRRRGEHFHGGGAGIGSFRYRGIPVASWLYRIAHHETVDALKRRRSALSLVDGDGPWHIDGYLPAIAVQHDIGAALGALKAEHREVLLLRFIEDRSVRDTAVRCGSRRVRSRCCRCARCSRCGASWRWGDGV